MPSKFRTWRSYPPEIVEIVTQFQLIEHIEIGPLPRRDAVALRTQIYRYRDALWNDYATDKMAEQLHDIVNTIMTSLKPADGAPGQVMLMLFLNPAVALFRKPAAAPSQEPAGAAEAAQPHSGAPTASESPL